MRVSRWCKTALLFVLVAALSFVAGLPQRTLARDGGERAPAARRPNVVFLLADDLGWSDLACYGADLHQTPRLDRLAAEGMRFTDAYAAAPVCSPTRASIMTGKAPARLHMTIWKESAKNRVFNRPLLPPDAASHLPQSERTLAKTLHQAGYFCAHVGKWHLGGYKYFPEAMGFDVNIGGTGWGAPNTYWWPYRGTGTFGDEYRYVPHLEWGKPGEYLTDRLTSEALKILERVDDRPFFLYLCWHAVHTPIEAKPELVEKYRSRLRPNLRHQNPAYAAMVETLDTNVGRVLDKLEELGLADNTIVFFTSDNGGFINRYRGQRVTNNFPLRSGKGSLYEGGVRVPLIVRWPGHVPAGSVCRQPVSSCDFYATILELLGLSHQKPARTEDGLSFASLLSNPEAPWSRQTLFWHYPHYYATTTPVSAVRQGPWKLLHYYEDDRVELYNLAEDLSETRDLAEQLPERAAELRRQLDQWLKQVDAQMPSRQRPKARRH